MKKILIIILFLVGGNTLIAQERFRLTNEDVPAHIMKIFSNRFPGALRVGWNEGAYGVYSARFSYGDRNWIVSMKPDGTILETKERIARKEFPVHLGNAIGDHLQDGFRILDAYRVDHALLGSYYLVELRSGGEQRELFLGENGSLLYEPQYTLE